MKVGLTVFSAKNAPFLNLNIPVPLVVVPSGKIKNGENFPVYSISSYLCLIAARAKAFFSSEPPLGMKIESITEQSVPSRGTCSKSFAGAKAGLRFLIRTTGSNQET